jgi:hypothetical protein
VGKEKKRKEKSWRHTPSFEKKGGGYQEGRHFFVEINKKKILI